MTGIVGLLMEIAAATFPDAKGWRAWLKTSLVLTSAVLLLVLAWFLLSASGAFHFLDTAIWR